MSGFEPTPNDCLWRPVSNRGGKASAYDEISTLNRRTARGQDAVARPPVAHAANVFEAVGSPPR